MYHPTQKHECMRKDGTVHLNTDFEWDEGRGSKGRGRYYDRVSEGEARRLD